MEDSHTETLFTLYSNEAESSESHRGDKECHRTGLLSPLAVRMRPNNLDEFYGQQKIKQAHSPIRQIINGNSDTSLILYGPPGTGKTTLAHIIAQTTGRHYESLSALDLSVKELRSYIDMARHRRARGTKTVLFIDEVHRFSKNQQDALLSAVENGVVMLIAATTENPSFAVISPLLSRSLMIALEPLERDDIVNILYRALTEEKGLNNSISISTDNLHHIATIVGGDARKALTILESVAQVALHGVESESSSEKTSLPSVTLTDIEQVIDSAVVRYDKHGDQHYDVISAYIKSMRGSDADAALHYLARMLTAGEDPRFIARRMMIFASEDIGMADSQALLMAHAAYQAASNIGMPEVRINLSHVTVYLCMAPKSNATYQAIGSALADIKEGSYGLVPPHLRDGHYAGASRLGHALDYRNPHAATDGVIRQDYIPEPLRDKQYYHPTQRGNESKYFQRWQKLRSIIRGHSHS